MGLCKKKPKYTTRKPIYFCQIVKTFEKEKEKLVFLCNDLYKKSEIAKASDELIFQALPQETRKKIK